ncbi:MAG TPA: hypothetical protein VF346_08435 [Bacteroidales bacterium]
MKRNILVIAVVFGLFGWSCSKVETSQQLSLKQSIEKSTADINTAISKISATKGYQVLSIGGDPVARVNVPGTTFKDSITLALVAGIYDYQFDTIPMHRSFEFPYRLFKKTGTSSMMIVNLPQRLIFHPRYLHSFMKPDSIFKNDFTITASDYHFYYNSWNSLDYKLTAGLILNSEDLGSFDISIVSTSLMNQSNSSKFTFTGGYGISTAWQSGDTSKSSFTLLKDNNALLMETTLYTGKDFHKREKQYDLTIGNVEIKRGFGIDSIQVYMNGVLQKKAGAKITDSADPTGTICNKRDILLTFDDGTTTKLSTLIGPPLTQLKTLVSSLHDMYFAENIVDYIAINIYFNSR